MDEQRAMFYDELRDLLDGEFTDDAIDVMVEALVATECLGKDRVIQALDQAKAQKLEEGFRRC